MVNEENINSENVDNNISVENVENIEYIEDIVEISEDSNDFYEQKENENLSEKTVDDLLEVELIQSVGSEDDVSFMLEHEYNFEVLPEVEPDVQVVAAALDNESDAHPAPRPEGAKNMLFLKPNTFAVTNRPRRYLDSRIQIPNVNDLDDQWSRKRMFMRVDGSFAEVDYRRTKDRFSSVFEPQKMRGSTRVEAKRQRRKDVRDNRKRQVVTESEFLARRDSIERAMLVRSKKGRIQIAVLEDNITVEHYVAKSHEGSIISNVYLGKVQNVLPSMEAAFVDIGKGRNAVLYAGEVDWQAYPSASGQRKIEDALKVGDKVLVQVTKDPVGHKGARLTCQISLPGRYLVFVPNGSTSGISRKLPDTERTRLKKILKDLLPDNTGVIVRTAAEGASEEQLARDVDNLMQQWESIRTKAESSVPPHILHSEPDMLVKIVRDVFNEDFSKIVISGDDAYETIHNYLSQVAPDLLSRVEKYSDSKDIFDSYRVSEQIAKALERKVWLPSGGSLVIDRTEAMTVIDVNTGKFVGSGGNLEETVTMNNLEAAEEIVNQLRLRDIGGIIVVDFIDMVLESNRDLVLRRLIECLSKDRTKNQVAEVTSLGLVQMTRKKLGLGLLESFSDNCSACDGRGVVIQDSNNHSNHSNHSSNNHKTTSEPRRRLSNSRNAQAHVMPVVTPAVSNALAQVAANTLGVDNLSNAEDIDDLEQKYAKSSLSNRDNTQDAKNSRTKKRGRGVAKNKPSNTEETTAPVDALTENNELSESVALKGIKNNADMQEFLGRDFNKEFLEQDIKAPRVNPELKTARPIIVSEAISDDANNDKKSDKTASKPLESAKDSILSNLENLAAEIFDKKSTISMNSSVKDEKDLPYNILDSVLENLPSPPEPGQGKRKSRRVTMPQSSAVGSEVESEVSNQAETSASASGSENIVENNINNQDDLK